MSRKMQPVKLEEKFCLIPKLEFSKSEPYVEGPLLVEIKAILGNGSMLGVNEVCHVKTNDS
ncbi:hypothetical protein D918_04767 [Trichuris suis]|nr:hypothetical protein D918_04767 [Trichuris suis]